MKKQTNKQKTQSYLQVNGKERKTLEAESIYSPEKRLFIYYSFVFVFGL